MHAMQGVLSGTRVLELGTFITGPCAGMMLADLGADVIKVESPEGDPYRSYQGGQYSPHFQAYNRNKRSIALDLKSAADRATFEQLAREADVFIQNFRPGTDDRLGAGRERLQALNDRLDYFRFENPGTDIIQEEQGLGSLDQNVVDAMIDQIVTDRVVFTQGESHFKLGSDSVGA